MLSILKALTLAGLIQVVLGATLGTVTRRDVLVPLKKPTRHGKGIPDSYTVVLNHGSDVENVLASLTNDITNQIRFKFKHALRGFSGKFDSAALELIRLLPAVDYVEQNQVYKINGTQSPAPFNLAIMSQPGPESPADQNSYNYQDYSDSRVQTVYVIDTGVYADNVDFQGRAYQAVSFIDGSNVDDNGHGTHVSGIVGGATYGVFKRAFITGVKVLDASGSGSTDSVVAGINWVSAYASGLESVINMSLQGGQSDAINQAVESAVAGGITVVVAAGNQYLGDSCLGSPSSSPSAITVGSIDQDYSVSYFSSVGSCLDIFAPGNSITSTWNTGPGDTMVESGTSMSSPHVAGLAAYFIAITGNSNPSAIHDTIVSNAQSGLIPNTYGSPNLIANNGYR